MLRILGKIDARAHSGPNNSTRRLRFTAAASLIEKTLSDKKRIHIGVSFSSKVSLP
jgi:hypothetical protein